MKKSKNMSRIYLMLCLGALVLLAVPSLFGLSGFVVGLISYPLDAWLKGIGLEQLAELFGGDILGMAVFSVRVTILSTLLALILCMGLLIYGLTHKKFWNINALALLLFIIPHTTFAVLLQRLLSPSGMLIGLVHALTGSSADLPSTTYLLNHSSAVGYIILMALKELPFLWFVALAVCQTQTFEQQLKVACSLGYPKTSGIVIFILPQIYRYLKLPLVTLIIFTMSHIEMALLVAPYSPQTIAVKMFSLFYEADVLSRQKAFMLGLIMILLTMISLLLFFALIKVVSLLCEILMKRIGRLNGFYFISIIIKYLSYFIMIMICFAIGNLVLLSIAKYWPFLELLPQGYTGLHWQTVWPDAIKALKNTLKIASVSVMASLVFVLLLLELFSARLRYPLLNKILSLLLSLPLVIPSLAFLFGIVNLVTVMGSKTHIFSVVLGHMIYMIPYLYFVLSKPFADFDPRWIYTSLSLGKTPLYSYFLIKLRLLSTPLLFSMLLGFIISFNQYLPTLLLGSGLIETLNTQAIIFAQSGSKRMMSVFSLLQIGMAFVTLLIGALGWFYLRRRPVSVYQ